MINPITIGCTILLLIFAFGIYDEWDRLTWLDWTLLAFTTPAVLFVGFLFL